MRDWLWIRMLFTSVPQVVSHAFENVELTVTPGHLSVRGTTVCRRTFAEGRGKKSVILVCQTDPEAAPPDGCVDCKAELLYSAVRALR